MSVNTLKSIAFGAAIALSAPVANANPTHLFGYCWFRDGTTQNYYTEVFRVENPQSMVKLSAIGDELAKDMNAKYGDRFVSEVHCPFHFSSQSKAEKDRGESLARQKIKPRFVNWKFSGRF